MSRQFNGISNALGTPITSVLRPNAPITVMAWVYPEVIAGAMGIFTSNKTDATHRGIWFGIADATGAIDLSFGDNGGGTSADRRTKTSTEVLVPGRWQHVLIEVRAATDMDIYIDGRPAGGTYTGTGGNLAYNTGVAGRIGSYGGTNFWNGYIGHVAVWGASLTAWEALALAQGLSPALVRPSSLIAYWSMRDNQAGVARDSAVGHNDATDSTGTLHAPGPHGVGYPVTSLIAGFLEPDVGPAVEAATVYLDLSVTSSDIGSITDSASAYLDLQPISTFEGLQRTDAATVLLDLSVLGGECYSRFHFTGEGEADTRWAATDVLARWASGAEARWGVLIEVQPGC